MSLTFRHLFAGAVAGLAASLVHVSAATAETFEITVKNLTHDQIFSPPLAVAHSRRLKVFEAGKPASKSLEILAEDGSPAALSNELVIAGADTSVNGGSNAAPVLPGESATSRLEASSRNRFISVLGMLVTTNDAFFGLNAQRAPERRKTIRVVAYDAGTEVNNEDCAHIPGPPCGATGELGANGPDENGVIHIHRGIHNDVGGGVIAAQHDWRNPVAEVTIRRISGRKKHY